MSESESWFLKRTFCICAAILLCVFISVSGLSAAGSAGISGADFLEIGIGSRSLSMGEAFTAEVNDPNSLYYNPAGLGSLKYPLLSLQHQELIVDSRLENLTVCYPISNGYLGFSNTLFWVPPFDKIDINGNKAGEVVFYNGCATLGYGYDFGAVYVGGSVKYVYQRIDTLFLNSAAVDVGILKGFSIYSPFQAPTKNFYLGLSLQNIGTPVKDDPLPRLLRLGLSYKLTHWLGLNMDCVENFIYASDLYDFTYGFNESFRVNAGVEFTYLELLSLRGGYRFNDGGTYTFGLGFNYSVGNVAFAVDASYADTKIFGPTYSINLTFKLIPKVVTIEDKIEAEKHYKQGIKHYISNDLDNALREFNVTKDFDPYYKNIDRKIRDIEEIKKLDKQNRGMEKELEEIEKTRSKESKDESLEGVE